MVVMVAALNPTMPHGWRPYHRPECRHVTKAGTVPENWLTMELEAALADERRELMLLLDTHRTHASPGQLHTITIKGQLVVPYQSPSRHRPSG